MRAWVREVPGRGRRPRADRAMSAAALVREGLAHIRAGQLDEAEGRFRAALAQDPGRADALHYLGLVFHQKGKFQDAADMLAQAAGPLSGNADFHANFGLALRDAGRWTRAKEEYARALAKRPDHPGATFNLAQVLGEEGDHAGAAALFAKLAARDPANAEARCFLGRALKAQGNIAEARAALGEAVRLDPRYHFAWARLAELELEAGDLDAALAAAKTVALAAPANFDAAVTVAEIHGRRGETAERDAWLARSRALVPDPAEFLFALGIGLVERSFPEAARRTFRRGLMFAPDHARMRWSLARLLPESYPDIGAIDRARAEYAAGLAAIEDSLRLDTPTAAREAFAALQTMTNFFLAYQERDDRDLQMRFGRIAGRVAAARFPEFARAPDFPPADPVRKPRIGFLSMYFCEHVVARLYAGWPEALDRQRFEVFGYHIGPNDDSMTRRMARHCDVFRHLPRSRAPAAAGTVAALDEWFAGIGRVLRSDRLDALIFTDIGMDPTSFALAALRFAPVQAAGIGHPVTTGLPTVDYFLSGELIEPLAGDAHYSEKLVRLPNLSLRLFDPIRSGDVAPRTRESFGFGADEIIYLCTQSIFKYLPGYDRIHAEIARALPKAKLVFVRSGPPDLDAVFLPRLARAFAAAGLDRDRHCLFLDRLSASDFLALHQVGDAFLDTPGWSGGNTTLGAISADLPVVTLPGEFMRGRVS
ncbi:MAG: tetratricopeptide repeat protein, partial [Rhodospirillales bacterium]|nr:tetratricopeptide repeat protein [Rhodospirillales bacterium]